ncbi:MAG: MerR family transcriptional regulator [Saprospiraceae bacterium]
MSTYSIKELGIISGIKPHTIRTWEQRYGILKPLRSDTNIRYYDDEQFKKLLNVKELLDAGMKISHIGNLSQSQFMAELDRVGAEAYKNEKHFEIIISQIIISIATFDEALFEKTFTKCVSKFGLTKSYLKVIYPTLTKIGLMWCKSDIMPAQEHFLSNLIKKKLFATIDSLPIPQDSDQTWILFLREQEEHEIGLLFAYYLLKFYQKRVVYLGANVPYDNLRNVAEQVKATHLYTFLMRNDHNDEMSDLIDKLNNDFKEATICFSGKKDIIEKITPSNKRIFINDVETLIKLIE